MRLNPQIRAPLKTQKPKAFDVAAQEGEIRSGSHVGPAEVSAHTQATADLTAVLGGR